jgi:hypothetical protein
METIMEEWRDIPGYEGYQVSNFGNVRSSRIRGGHRKWSIGKTYKNKTLTEYRLFNNYILIRTMLRRGGKNSLVSVHHLVALAFIGPVPEGQIPYHKNGDGRDNRADNIAYATQPNAKRESAVRNYLNGKSVHNNKYYRNDRAQKVILFEYICSLLCEQVRCKNMTLKDAGNVIGLSESAMCRRVNGERANVRIEKYRGYIYG